jgi:hypothetical protein
MTGNDTNIFITDHAVERYIERYATHLFAVSDCKLQRKLAEEAIKSVFNESDYISDHEQSILFRHREFKIDMLVKFRKIITLFPSRAKYNGKRHK